MTPPTEQIAGGVVWMPLRELKRWARNPRKNDGAPVARVAASIRRFGFVAPVVLWASARRLVAGHTRAKALESLLAADPTFVPQGAPGAGLVPVRLHEFASEAEADAYALADNRLQEFATWDGDRPKRNDVHPTMKPVPLVAHALAQSSAAGDVVLDPFGGSGSTLIAAAQTRRVARVLELDPKYCDVIRRRWTAFAREAGVDAGAGALD